MKTVHLESWQARQIYHALCTLYTYKTVRHRPIGLCYNLLKAHTNSFIEKLQYSNQRIFAINHTITVSK